MRYLVKVRVDVARMAEFGRTLQNGELDRSCIRGDTYCLLEDPAVGFSVWEAASRDEFEQRFAGWRPFYSSVDVREVVSPGEAMVLLMKQMQGARSA